MPRIWQYWVDMGKKILDSQTPIKGPAIIDRRVVLERQETGPMGTFGQIHFDGRSLFTGELPERENIANLSCIPTGLYQVIWSYSPAFKRMMFLVTSVKGRSGIRIHSGNLCGDRSMGHRTHVYGCILLGRKMGYLHDQKAVLVSRAAITDFQNTMGRKPFEMEIV